MGSGHHHAKNKITEPVEVWSLNCLTQKSERGFDGCHAEPDEVLSQLAIVMTSRWAWPIWMPLGPAEQAPYLQGSQTWVLAAGRVSGTTL